MTLAETNPAAVSSLSFPNGVTLDLSIQNGLYRGIHEARLDGEIFLVAGRGTRPYCVTPDGIAFTQFRILDRVSHGDAVTLECEATGYAAPLQQSHDMFDFPLLSSLSGAFTDNLRIHFRPRTLTVGEQTYRGFEISYEWQSAERKIHWLHESVALAPGGHAANARMLAQNMTAKSCPLEAILQLDSTFSNAETYDSVCIQSPGRGGGSQIFDLVSGPRLAAVSFFESAVSHGIALKATCEKSKGEDFVTSSDLHYGKLSSHFASAPRVVLAASYPSTTREDDINRWTAWFDYTARLWCDELGIKRTKSLPVLAFDGTGVGGIDPGTTYPELLKVWAGRIDWVAERGFKGIILHTPEWIGAANRETLVFRGNNCSPWQFRLSDFLGGEPGLRAFCDVCHSRGIKVYVWIAGHLQREAPIWKQHPDWMVRKEDLSLWDGHYGGIHSLSFVSGGAEWVLGDLTATRDATGIDGVWFDSFTNLSLGSVNYQSPGLEPNAPAVLRFLGGLSAAGFEIMIEGISQLGVSSWGNMKPSEIIGHEELMANCSPRYYLKYQWMAEPNISRDLHFKMLAARAPMGVWIEEYLGRSQSFPFEMPEWFASLTNAYNRVAPRMEKRLLVKNGALWFDDKGQPSAFFAFEDAKGIDELDTPASLTDALTNKMQSTDKLVLTQGHIYEVHPPS